MNWKQIKHLRNQIGDKHKCSVATICGTKYLFVLYEDKNIQDYIYNKFRYYLPPNTIAYSVVIENESYIVVKKVKKNEHNT